MKKLCAALLCAAVCSGAAAQDNLLDKNEDELFEKSASPDNDPYSIGREDFLQAGAAAPGFGLDASYSVGLGIFPGFSETPWNFKKPWRFNPEDESFDAIVGASMSATIGLTIQPSSMLRVRQTVNFAIPSVENNEIPISFKEFFLDYNFINIAYIRAGKFDLHWGCSPNFPYTDLVARVPLSIENPGDAYSMRVDVPIGIGGLQFIMMARRGLLNDVKKPKIEEFGYGMKFNLAIPFIDVDLGVFYHKIMPLRFFLSMNKTFFRTWEIYAEAMASYTYDQTTEIWRDFLFSYNAGFIQDFFGGRLKLNAELYYNAEQNGYAITKNKIKPDEDDKTLLLQAYNAAFNISFNPRILFNTTFFSSFVYSLGAHSGQVIPGIRLEPVRHLKVYITLQMALGSREENSYYTINTDTANRPFAVSIIGIISGMYNFNKFEN
ncbi:MAG: hypothetical protein LBC72_04850 [Spirochaetaceae bacterium]|jgi:hypothetical protein|nr:hypothetical protein [Spirochaetaceae bacterium]